MENKSIFTAKHQPHTSFYVNGYDAVLNTGDYEIGFVSGCHRQLNAIVTDTVQPDDNWYIVNMACKRNNIQSFDSIAVLGVMTTDEAEALAYQYFGKMYDSVQTEVLTSNTGGLQRYLNHEFYNKRQDKVLGWQLAKLQDVVTTEKAMWDEARLVSHDGLIGNLLLDMQRNDDNNDLMYAYDGLADYLAQYDDVEIDEYDAIYGEYRYLEKFIKMFHKAMSNASKKGVDIKGYEISKPFKRNGVAQVAVYYQMSDGQTVTVLFHNPDTTPSKLSPDDVVISWKWVLNSRDITSAVQPNQGEGISFPVLANRLMLLVNKNSSRFVRNQQKKAQMEQEVTDGNARLDEKQATLDNLNVQIEDWKAKIDDLQVQANKVLADNTSKIDEINNWAEDEKQKLTKEIKKVDLDIRKMVKKAKEATSLDEKIAFQEKQKKLEGLRNKLRREIFDKQDEIEAQREAKIAALQVTPETAPSEEESQAETDYSREFSDFVQKVQDKSIALLEPLGFDVKVSADKKTLRLIAVPRDLEKYEDYSVFVEMQNLNNGKIKYRLLANSSLMKPFKTTFYTVAMNDMYAENIPNSFESVVKGALKNFFAGKVKREQQKIADIQKQLAENQEQMAEITQPETTPSNEALSEEQFQQMMEDDPKFKRKMNKFAQAIANAAKDKQTEPQAEIIELPEIIIPENPTAKDLGKIAQDYLRKNVQGKSITTIDGKTVHFNRDLSVDHLSHDARVGILETKALSKIVEVFSKGDFIERQELYKERKDNIVAFHIYRKQVQVDDLSMLLQVKAAEKQNGELEVIGSLIAYSHKVLDSTNETGNAPPVLTSPNGERPSGGFAAINDDNTVLFDSLQQSDDYLIEILEVKDSEGNVIDLAGLEQQTTSEEDNIATQYLEAKAEAYRQSIGIFEKAKLAAKGILENGNTDNNPLMAGHTPAENAIFVINSAISDADAKRSSIMQNITDKVMADDGLDIIALDERFSEQYADLVKQYSALYDELDALSKEAEATEETEPMQTEQTAETEPMENAEQEAEKDFLQSVIDGKVDVMEEGLDDKLMAIAEKYDGKGDEMEDLVMQAANAYTAKLDELSE